MSRNQRRRGFGLRTVIIGLGLLAVAAAIVLGLFQIRSVKVAGNSRYSAEQIKDDLIYDFWTRNTLFFAWKYKSSGYESRTPYLTRVQAQMTSPGSVTVTVQEKEPIGCVQYDGSQVTFDSEGTVLSISDQMEEGVILITGVTMDKPVLYQKIPVTNTALLRTMLSIVGLLREASLSPDSVAFDDNLNITVSFGAVSVDLGQDEYLEEKVANLAAIYPKVQGQTGTLNMSAFTGKNETITFKEQETESVTEAQTQETGAEGETWAQESTDTQESGQTQEDTQADTQADTQESAGSGVMAFDSSGTLHYDARIVNGQVVDGSGNPIDGCSVTEDGYIKDAYWNVIDPVTGQLVQ